MACYLVHFSEPLEGGQEPQHYLGSTDRDVYERFDDHLNGKNRPAKIIQAALQRGLTVEIVRVWPNEGYDFEKMLKKRKKGFRRWCPKCGGNEEKERGDKWWMSVNSQPKI